MDQATIDRICKPASFRKTLSCANCSLPLTTGNAFEEVIPEGLGGIAIEHRACSKECFFEFNNKLRVKYGQQPLKREAVSGHDAETWVVFSCSKCKKANRQASNQKAKTCVCGNIIEISKGEILFSGTASECRDKITAIGGETEEFK